MVDLIGDGTLQIHHVHNLIIAVKIYAPPDSCDSFLSAPKLHPQLLNSTIDLFVLATPINQPDLNAITFAEFARTYMNDMAALNHFSYGVAVCTVERQTFAGTDKTIQMAQCKIAPQWQIETPAQLH